jgi:hypothetical protein
MAPTADTALGEEMLSSERLGGPHEEQDLQLPYTPRGPDPGGGRMLLEESLSMAARLSPPLVGTQNNSEPLSLPPKKSSPPPYASSALRMGAGVSLLGYPSTFTHLPPESGSSFTNTFLRGILTSIDSKVRKKKKDINCAEEKEN